MANRLTEAFFKDLEDLEEDEENKEIEEENPLDEQHKEVINEMKEEYPKISNENGSILVDVGFQDLLKQVDHFSSKNIKEYARKIDYGDIEYHLIQNCNKFSNNIDREVVVVHKTVRDLYYKKFPELESIVLNPIDYVKCVMKILNETDLTKINLSDLLTNHQIVAVNVAASSAAGVLLNSSEMKALLDNCEIILKLEAYKSKILSYVESRMQYIAPNLSAIVGSTVAAQLISAAGGLESLSRMPACNIQVIGSQKKSLLGFSKASSKLNQGFFGNLDMVKKAPTQFQIKLIRMLSTNCAKAARIDNLRMCLDGSLGEKIREDMQKRFSKIQEPPPAKKVKPLPVPDEKPRKKRGGKRFRNLKEKLALTDIRKYKNRMNFGPEAQKEFRESGHGFGMLGVGIGKVKMQTKDNKINLTKKQRVFQEKTRKTTGESGLASSVAFTPVQGMYLANPDLAKTNDSNKTEMYFNKESGFKTVIEERKNKNLFNNLLPT